MRKFTDQELLEAWKQIEDKRREEQKRAEKAAKWLHRRCSLPVGASWPPSYVGGGRADAPYLTEYGLVISYCQYDDFNTWLKERLGPSGQRRGFHLDLGPDEGFPAGTRYYCALEYYDAHSAS